MDQADPYADLNDEAAPEQERPPGHEAAEAAAWLRRDWLVLHRAKVVVVRGRPTRFWHPSWPRELEVPLAEIRGVEILPPTWTEDGFIRLRLVEGDLTNADSPLSYAAVDGGFSAAIFSEWTAAKMKMAQRKALRHEAQDDRLAILFHGKAALSRARDISEAIRAKLSQPSENSQRPAASEAKSPADRLAEIAGLREAGLIDPKEYEELRRRILDGI